MIRPMAIEDCDPEDQPWMRALKRHMDQGQLDAFGAQGEACGWCAQPIRLRGVVVEGRGSSKRLRLSTTQLPDGVVLKACGSRRETICPSCAAIYRGDARHLVRAGLVGGKGMSEDVATRPMVLLTLTAPSFGAVHNTRAGKAPCNPGPPKRRCRHGRPTACFARHGDRDPCVGRALCADCYDFRAAVLHNACAPELWRRTSVYLPRALARVVGVTQPELAAKVKLSFVKVAEFQRRGVVHLHVLVRADALCDTGIEVTPDDLSLAAMIAARQVRVAHPIGTARWGEQTDVRPLDLGGTGGKKIATYIAKYVTKSTDTSGVLDRKIRDEDDLATRLERLDPHTAAMLEAAWRLGGDPAFARLHLRRHAHGLGYGGHRVSKSPSWSTTFAELARARFEWREARRVQRQGEGTTIESRLRPVGVGWANRGEALWAHYRRKSRAEERAAGWLVATMEGWAA